MELNEKLDKSYNKDKRAYEKVKILETEIKALKEEFKREKRAKEDVQIKKIRAHEDKDKAKEKDADEEIKKIEEKIKEIKGKISKKEKILTDNKEKVDSYINELNKDPEFQAQMNYILEKKYNRTRKKVIKEKEQIDLIIDLCEKHPSLEINLKGMIRAAENLARIREQMKKIDDDVKKLDPVKDAAKIKQIYDIEIPSLTSARMQYEKKSNMNETAFMDFCQKNNVDVDKEFLERLVAEKGFSHNKGTGEIQALKSLKKISKGYNFQIQNIEKSIQKIPGATIDKPEKEGTEEQNKGTQGKESSTKGNKKDESTKDEINGNNLPDKKYKWYELGKKFNAWRERKRVEKEAKNRTKKRKTRRRK